MTLVRHPSVVNCFPSSPSSPSSPRGDSQCEQDQSFGLSSRLDTQCTPLEKGCIVGAQAASSFLDEGHSSPFLQGLGFKGVPEDSSPSRGQMQEECSRVRVPTQRLKSTELRETSRAHNEASGAGTSQEDRQEPKAKKSRSDGEEVVLPSIGKAEVGTVVEMFEKANQAWQKVRIIDFQGDQVHVVPHGANAGLHASSSASWSMRWISFRKGLFRRRTAPPAVQAGVSEEGARPMSRMAAASADDDEKRPERIRKVPRAFCSRSSKDIPRSRALKSRRRSDFKRKGKAAIERYRRARKNRAKRTEVGGSDIDTDSDGSEYNGSSMSSHRRDWGLMHVDVVGRNRPPFARTLLFHGAIQPGVRYSGEPSPATSWVVKRWPERSNRRKVDLEVHEMIRSNPCKSLVEIVDVHTMDGVLMEFCKEGDLQTLLAKSRRRYMPLREVTTRFLDTMEGLAHLHKLKIVHADVSPQNVFLRPKTRGTLECVLGDFGHSYVLDQHSESRSSVADHCGQGAEFVAPEVLAGSVSTMESDVYSAGRILAQMLSLCKQFQDPFEKESKALVRSLNNLATAMCRERPGDRPSSAKVCKELMKAITW